MKVHLLRRILKDLGRKDVAASSKTRNLRVETLENRELLDASGILVASAPATDVDVAPLVAASEENVVASLDLAVLAQSETAEANAATIEAPATLELGVYDVDTEKLPMCWDAVDSADGYRVEYTTNGGKSWKLSAVVDGNVTSRLASKVHMNLEYIFRIQAFNETTASEWTYSKPFYYTQSLPDAPHTFRLGEYDSSAKTLTMDWDKVDYVDGYRVQYSIDGGTSWYNSETLYGDDSTSRTAWKVYTDREYQFRVCTFNEIGDSEWTYSDKFHVNYDSLENPSFVKIGAYDASTRKLETSWGAVDNATGYEVQYSLDKGKTWRLSEKLYSGSATSRLATSVVPGTTYEFRVRAFNAIGMSDWTYSELYTPPALLTAPAFLEVVSYDVLTRKLSLVWGDVPDEDGYKVEYSTDNGENWTVAFKTEADVTDGVAEDINPGTFYVFRVRAYNKTDVSPWVEIPFYVAGDASMVNLINSSLSSLRNFSAAK